MSGYAFWLYVLNPPGERNAQAASQETAIAAGESSEPALPVEEGPGAELISRAQKQFRSDQHEEALKTLKLAQGESPNVAGSLIRHAEVALAEIGSCRLAGLGHPRPFDSAAPASHARIVQTGKGILAMWTDSHQDPKRRNVYSAVLDDSLRRISPVRNATPEATTAIHPAITPLPDGYATLYWDSAKDDPGVYVRAIESDGRIRTPARLLSGQKKDQYFPTLTVLPGGDLLSVWSEKVGADGHSNIVVRQLSRELEPKGPPHAVTNIKGAEATQPFARVFGETLFIAYRHLITGQTSEIRLLRIPLSSEALSEGIAAVDPEAQFAGESITLRSQPRQAEPSMTCDQSGCIVVWDDESSGAFAGFVPPDQTAPLWHRQFSTKGKRPIVARNRDGEAAIAYFAGDRLFIAPVNRDGIGAPSVVSRVSGFQPTPHLVAGQEPGEWLIAWRDFEAGHLEIFVARAHCSPSLEH